MSQLTPPTDHPSESLEFTTAFPLKRLSDDSTIDTAPDHTTDQKDGPLPASNTLSANLNGSNLDITTEHRDVSTPSCDMPRPTLTQSTKMDTFHSDMTTATLNIPKATTNALAAIQSEHGMTFRQGMRLYPKAVFWSAMISLAIVMDGFDTGLVSSFFAFPQFQQAYGVQRADGRFEISTKWQILFSNGSVIGSIIGLLGNGPLAERFGYRYTMLGALILLTGFIFMTFFAPERGILLAGQICCGLSWGTFSTLTATYAAEVMPLNLRGYLTANVNLCWLIGQITAMGTLRGFLEVESQWSYRVPFGIQWVWIVIATIAVAFAPESPWWLVRKGHIDKARHALNRLTRKNLGFNPDNTIEMMQHTDAVEMQLNNGKGRRNDLSYGECFRGSNLRRTEIACMVFISQVCSGLPLCTFATYFFSEIGLSTGSSFDMTVGMYGLGIVGALVALGLLKLFGRRPLFLGGMFIMMILLLIIGILGCVTQTTSTLWTSAGLVLLLVFVFDATVGPITYVLVTEIPSTRLKVNTVVLARICYNLCTFVTNVLINKMLNPLGWQWGGKSCFMWAGTNLFCLVYCYWRLPETRGLSYHELDILFEKQVPARKFQRVQKKLEDTGYFGFYEEWHKPEQAAWHV